MNAYSVTNIPAKIKTPRGELRATLVVAWLMSGEIVPNEKLPILMLLQRFGTLTRERNLL
jgi:hypothetical protein